MAIIYQILKIKKEEKMTKAVETELLDDFCQQSEPCIKQGFLASKKS